MESVRHPDAVSNTVFFFRQVHSQCWRLGEELWVTISSRGWCEGCYSKKNARQAGCFQPIERRSCKGAVVVRPCLHFELGEKAITAPRVGSSAEMIEKRPRQELNLIYDLRRVACCPSHSKDRLCFITPPRNRTSPDCFEDSHASSTLAGHFIKEPTTGFAPA